jgi:hypothetical protein
MSSEREPAPAMTQMDMSPCHEQESKTDGLCVLHCVGEKQSLDKPSVKLPSIGVAPVLVVLGPALHSPSYVGVEGAPARASAPPPRILFSRLLI